MPLPEINLRNIRQHRGSQADAFEELCCQLASLEDRPQGAVFHRKGAGSDAGVECFLRLDDGTETGWQVKYYQEMGNSLISKLNDSIDTALKKHPDLKKYIVCIPFNLSDSRKGKEETPLEKWNKWKEKWEKEARQQNREIEIELWNESVVIERLNRDSPLYSGRIVYWFDQELLTEKWFETLFDKACTDLGQRYTPKTNVTLPIRKNILATARAPFLNKELQNWEEALKKHEYYSHEIIKDLLSLKGVEQPSLEVKSIIAPLIDALSILPIGVTDSIPSEKFKELADNSYEQIRELENWVWNQKPIVEEDDKNKNRNKYVKDRALNELFKLNQIIWDISKSCEEMYWKAANAKQILVYGDGGRGKSHLLADSCKYQLDKKQPALFFLGSKFNDKDIGVQILQELDLPKHYQFKTFLGAIDAAGQASNSRALLVIDALNERKGVSIWKHRLASFLHSFDEYPHIAVLLSCRTPFLQSIIPDTLDDEKLPKIEHTGFSFDDAKYYLKVRGFVLPGSPNLMPEFTNPLFLKTCCDSLEKDGQKLFPRGLNGISAVFEFYNQAVIRALNEKMGLEPRKERIEHSINALIQAYVENGNGYLAYSDVNEIFEKIHPSQGLREQDMLSNLESEGMLSVELFRNEAGQEEQMVRFTFERFSDHAIAAKLLEDSIYSSNLNNIFSKIPVIGSFFSSIEKAFSKGSYLHDFCFGERQYSRASIIDAIAIQLVEKYDTEIFDVIPKGETFLWAIREAFRRSLLLRNPKNFTGHTLELVRDHYDQDILLDTLIAMATEPDTNFNAEYLDSRLQSLDMPKRDVVWSIYVAQNGEDESSSLQTLISWARSSGFDEIDADRAKLAAIILTWCFSTSNRLVRDHATKALVTLLAPRITLGAELLRKFSHIDDLYILERLTGSIYGALLQGLSSDEEISNVSKAIYEEFFSNNNPPVHAVLRDSARGIIEYANFRDCLHENIDIEKARPPYLSPWPIEYVSNDTVESYREEINGNSYTDSIVSSVVNDGDFARYVMDYEVSQWSPASIGTWPLPKDNDVYEQWYNEFESWASDEMKLAFENLLEKKLAVSAQGPYSDTPEMQEKKNAEEEFKALIGNEKWEDYRVRGAYRGHSSSFHTAGNATFNQGWARRWVCKRAHELGWSPEQHSEFDRSRRVGMDRHNHRIERVGKKYQWIALNELKARMSDNLAYHVYSYEEAEEPKSYKGEWHGHLRHIDPTLLIEETADDGWKQWKEPCWWMPVVPQLNPVDPVERMAWRDNGQDLINDSKFIDLTDADGKEWLALHTLYSWRQSRMIDGNSFLERDLWGRIKCIVVTKENKDKLLKSINGKLLTDPYNFSDLNFYTSSGYLGEYPWHPAFKDGEDVDEFNKFDVPVKSTIANYTCERGGYDYSLGEHSVSVNLPAPWIVGGMEIRQSSRAQGSWVNGSEEVTFIDPAIFEEGPHAALIDKKQFLDFLEKADLCPVWVLAGEKGVFGGKDYQGGFGGRYLYTSVYELKKGNIEKVSFYEDWQYPTKEQLTTVLGYEPPTDMKVRSDLEQDEDISNVG